MTRRLGLLGAVALVAVLFLAVNMLAGATLRSLRFDATQGRAFTLTTGSRAIARAPDEPVRLTFYYSAKLAAGRPTFQRYAQRVRELLEEYARVSGGKVRLEVVDPEPFSEQEDRAVAAGVQGIPTGVPGENVYFGLAGTNSVDGREVIPVFDPSKERFLEYDVTRLLYALANPVKRVVGLMTGLPMEGGFSMDPRTGQPAQTPPWRMVEELRAVFEVRSVATDAAAIPPEIGVLILAHPKGLSDATLYAIDQFVMRGGRLLAFVDPLCENDPAAPTPADRASDLSRLLGAWGVEVAPGTLAADGTYAMRVMTGTRERPEAVPYVVWLAVPKDGLSADDAVTGGLGQVNLATAGVIGPKAAAEGATPVASPVTITPIITTSDKAARMATDLLGFPPDPKKLLLAHAPGSERLTLAARLTGAVASAFPDGAPTPADAATPAAGAPPTATHLARSEGPINIVLVADADLLSDDLWVREENLFGQFTAARRLADNADLVVGAADQLGGSDDLLSVRARGASARPFDVVEGMRRRAEARYLAEQTMLEEQLALTQRKIAELEQAKGGEGGALMLTPEQEAEIERFRAEQVQTRAKLREVRLGLRRDIERLGDQLTFLNVAAVPLLVAVGAAGLGWYRASRRGAARSGTATG